MFLLLSAHAVPFVIADPAQRPAVEDAVRELWPDADVTVRSTPTPDVPRFELSYDTLFWVTSEGVHQREVSEAETAVLLARTWTVSGPPETELGWVPQPAEAVDSIPEPEPVVVEEATERWLSDVWFGLGARFGRPRYVAISGVGTVFAVQRQLAFLQLRTSSRMRSIDRNELFELEQRGIPSVYAARYGIGLHLGLVSRPLALRERTHLKAYGMIGPEVQESVFQQLNGNDIRRGSRWDLGGQLGVGSALQLGSIGFRLTAMLDVRESDGPFTARPLAMFDVVFHP